MYEDQTQYNGPEIHEEYLTHDTAFPLSGCHIIYGHMCRL